ncbi:mitogen-activated protein kinase kinase kinase 1-like isoform X1 [Juglans microcarpa x Juglans regia]|uniref:mitogen-activated protein kinase kinase kinase 1-like isoform X1 n=1 Tax=Juglans microcarpa x Juglans regia TaxID=2249226 RepID=UPI001B7E4DD5|nr:mitogen-activated protein kinase kinase kinase 1-like isoform X1 [Juglans microcarpa x Juglans regia]
MGSKQKRLRPKLERRNAIRNVDYYAPPSPSSTFDHDQSSSASGLRSRSLDLYAKQTSFRVRGIEGEFELICRSLGLSGPDDFSIPAAAWEAQKARSSSDLASRSRLRDHTSSAKPAQPEPEDDFSAEFQARVRLGAECANAAKQSSSSSAKLESRLKVISDSVTVGPSGGIKGSRPPFLSPPPVMMRPMVDNVSSTWDILNSFAPRDDVVSNPPSRDVDVSFSDEDEVIEENGKSSGEIGKREESDEETDCRFQICSPRSDDNSNANDDHEATIHTSSVIMVYTISPSGQFRRSITSWQKGELLGSGSFGTVYEGFTEDGFFFAVKEVSLLDQGSQGKQSIFQLEQEIYLLSQFQHDNIVQYLGTDKDESKLYIFLELVTKGSLASLYKKYQLRDSQVSAYTRQILNGLMYLHDRDVVHRDIKCANILVDASGSVKLADFGLAKATKLNDVKSSKGTAFWMAPEQLQVVNLKNHGYGLAADIWSLGCTVLEMLTCQAPYSHLEGMQALFMIGRGKPPPVRDSLSRDARDFILKCLQVNPNDRPTAAQLLDHPFLRRPPLNSIGPASPHFSGMRS